MTVYQMDDRRRLPKAAGRLQPHCLFLFAGIWLARFTRSKASRQDATNQPMRLSMLPWRKCCSSCILSGKSARQHCTEVCMQTLRATSRHSTTGRL